MATIPFIISMAYSGFPTRIFQRYKAWPLPEFSLRSDTGRGRTNGGTFRVLHAGTSTAVELSQHGVLEKAAVLYVRQALIFYLPNPETFINIILPFYTILHIPIYIQRLHNPFLLILSLNLSSSHFLSRHRLGFPNAKVCYRAWCHWLEVNFLQILPPSERNWQEKPSHEAVPIAVCGIVKLQKRFRQKGTDEREKTNIHITSNS